MKTLYAGRYPTRNVGFGFVLISLFLSLTIVGFFVTVIINQHRRGEPDDGTFNWPIFVVTAGLLTGVFWFSIAWLERLLKNEPRQVKLETGRILIEKVPNRGKPGLLEVEIPLAGLLSVDQQDIVIADETAKGGLRFKGLLFQWRDTAEVEVQNYRLSERDVVDFDELIEDIFNQIAPAARGQRTFDR